MMYDELVNRLREEANCPDNYPEDSNLMREAADAIEELSKPKWIPVTERLPEPTFAREWFLVCLESGCVKTLAFEKEGRSDNLWHVGWHETASPVTHWMPLPEPPKEE